ncbi:hypothetical protein N24_0641 [Corynebacterium suranareeae]|uniref:Uncharacterized protein n=1 Tax=Corynebacterium suranareeae TaxID=2506452 RepID=A0A160PPP3_9CORY|nr:hypothetical protein [Corynebacterium suranareeae]BAU94903.1 hypothetical protein N24_0641 [Corynebacterium suranareeae]
MNDHVRIPVVLEQLRLAWEGQPELSLATLFGILSNQGIGWGTDDETLMEALAHMRTLHPAEISGPIFQIDARYVVETADNHVTVDPYRVVVRPQSTDGDIRQPGIWGYSKVQCRVGTDLVVSDQEGSEHHLGLVKRITLADSGPRPEIEDLSGFRREGMAEQVFALLFDDDTLVLLDHRMTQFHKNRRAVDYHRMLWDRVIQARPGESLQVSTPSGIHELGIISKIIPVN